MKGNETLVKMLQMRLGEQHAAVLQYMIQSEISEKWGYSKLASDLRSIAIQEMKHAEKHIERIVFLEYTPDALKLGMVNIGKTVSEFLEFGRDAETTAVNLYAATIKAARGFEDVGTAEYLEHILNEEEEHLRYFESQLTLIKQMGIQNYLSTKA